MVRVKLEVKPRPGKSNSYKHNLKEIGKIPGVIYGKNMSNKLIEVDVKNLEGILRKGGGRNSIIDLTLKEEKPSKITVMIKDLQRDPVKGELIHADLQKISLKEKIHTAVPVRYVGESVGVKKGGILQSDLRELEVEGIPTELPEYLEVDITPLDIGDHLTAGDIKLEGTSTITNDPSSVIVSIIAPRLAETEDEAANPKKTETPAAATADGAE